ncbi:MAG: hypothetical protein ACYCS1_08785 [Gammaproteobacteria bacterium]
MYAVPFFEPVVMVHFVVFIIIVLIREQFADEALPPVVEIKTPKQPHSGDRLHHKMWRLPAYSRWNPFGLATALD